MTTSPQSSEPGDRDDRRDSRAGRGGRAGTDHHEQRDRGLWHHADFLRLWAAQAISAFGSRITRTALPIIAVTTLGETEAVVGVLAAMQLAPGVVLAMVAGGFVDRSRKREILIWADLIRAVLVGSLTLAWALGALSIVHVVVVGAGVGAATALFQITDNAYLPSLIGRRHLAEGNAKLETTEAIAEITGPASAGALIAALGAPLSVAIDAVSYLWSAFMLGRIRIAGAPPDPHPVASARSAGASSSNVERSSSMALSSSVLSSPSAAPSGAVGLVATVPDPAADPAEEGNDRDGCRDQLHQPHNRGLGPDRRNDAIASPGEPGERPLRTGEDFRFGLRVVFGHAQVRPIILTLMVWSIAGGFFLALYTPFCLRELQLAESMFGVIIAMGGVGSLAGAVLARTLSRALGVGRTLLVTSTLSLVFTLLVPIAGSVSSHAVAVGLLMAHQLLGDCFAVAFVILAVTLRQTVLPRAVLGRANAAVHVCTTGVLPVFALIAGGLATLVGIREAVWLGFLVGLAAPVFLWPLRHLEVMPLGDPGASDSGVTRIDARS